MTPISTPATLADTSAQVAGRSLAERLTALYPGTKFIVALTLGISAFVMPGYWYAFGVGALVIILSFCAGHGPGFLRLLRNSLLVLMIFMFTIRSLFSGGEDVLWSAGPLTMTTEGVLAGLIMCSRVLALGSALLLFFRITPVREITSGMENAGLPPSAAYVVLSAIQMIPQMRAQSAVIMDAQKTRGVETEGGLRVRMKAFVPTLRPLVLSSIAATEERVITLESRAFTAPGRRTRLYRAVKRPVDRAVSWAAIIILALLIIGRIAAWVL